MEQVRREFSVSDVLVNVVGHHPDVGVDQHARDRGELLGSVNGAGRVRRRVEHDAARARRDRAAQCLGLEHEAGLFRARHELRLGARQRDHRGEADPRRRRDDHLVAFVEQRGDHVGFRLLASRRRDYLARLVVEVVVALELELDRILERRSSAHRRVLGLSRVERLDGGPLDVLRRVEVGLAGGQRDDVDSSELHFGGARVGGQRGGRFDSGNSAIELQHFLNPILKVMRAALGRRDEVRLYLSRRLERTADEKEAWHPKCAASRRLCARQSSRPR